MCLFYCRWSPDKFIRVITPRTPRSPRDVSLFSDTGVAAYCDITIQSPDLVGTALGRPYTADTVVSIGSMDGGPQVTPQHSRKQSHYTAARPSPIRLEATLPPNTQNPTDMCWKLVEDPVIGALIQHLPAVIGVSGLTLHDACARIASTFNDGDPNAKVCGPLFSFSVLVNNILSSTAGVCILVWSCSGTHRDGTGRCSAVVARHPSRQR